ncbi:MAG TPA: hypothetical protein VFX92_09120 [Candidatus Krumholzibacteria bacterium]|nr:hypothetical protein [Candidatus Krumholzibacteria bacterium]
MDVEALQKMTVAELREEARKLDDVKGLASMKKDELVQLLAGGQPAAKANSRRGAGTGRLDLPALKQKVRELKRERTSAAEHSRKAKVTEFNTDLRMLRRKLRKAARRRRKKS